VHQKPTSIKRFPLNQHGRDFIAGDIHGCFDDLNSALDKHQFNPKIDRLFTVGDLIDRGPGSYKVLSWLKQPWFHSCLGNHEEMILTTAADSTEGLNWYQSYGGEWWLEQTADVRAEISAAFAELPLVIELETSYGKIGIVHADIPKGMNWSGFIRLLELGDSDTRKTALWGRRRIKRLISSPIKGIERVVCGHTLTANRKIITKANVWFIETGAYLRDEVSRLTVINTEQLFE